MSKLSKQQRSLRQYQRHAKLAWQVIEVLPSAQIVDRFVPQIKPYYPGELATEGIFDNSEMTDESAERIVDKVFVYGGKILKALFKLSKALWRKLMELGGKLLKYIDTCISNRHGFKTNMELTVHEGRKLINIVKDKCDLLINQGVVSDYTLQNHVDIILQSTNVKTKPFDPQNPSSVKQWLETINLASISFTRIDGLPYSIPEQAWKLYAYNPKYNVFSKESVTIHKALNNYYFKLVVYAKDYLRSDRLLHVIRDTLSGKIDSDPTETINVICTKLIEPFLQFELPYIDGNITLNKAIWLSNTTISETYKKAYNKIEGLEAALTLFTPTITEANPQLYIKQYDLRTTIPEMSNFSNYIGDAMGTLLANQHQLFKRDVTVSEGVLVTETNLKRILQEIYGSVKDLEYFTKLLLDVAKRLDRILNNFYTYHQQLTTAQLRVLEDQQRSLLSFVPVLE